VTKCSHLLAFVKAVNVKQSLQLLGGPNLVILSWIAVEHEYQSLVVEVLDFRLHFSNVEYFIALR
jgi:hypothetical protein